MEEDIYINLRYGVDEIKNGNSMISDMITPEEIGYMYGFINYLEQHPKVFENYLKHQEKYRKDK